MGREIQTLNDRQQQATASLRRHFSRITVWAAVGVLAGTIAAAKGIDTGSIRAELLAFHGLWFSLAAEIGRPLRIWVPLGLGVGLGIGVIHALLSPAPRPRGRRARFLHRAILFAGTVLLLISAILVTASMLRPNPKGPNIVLVVLDTARRDRFSLYGYERPTTPYMEALANESTVFTEAYSTSSWTPPAHASLFTGLYSCAHHVTQESWFMADHLLTLAEALWEMGYRTAAMVGNPMLSRQWGHAQGFEEYHELWREEDANPAEHPALRRLRNFLDSPSDRPFFVFLNFMEPHSPYDSSRQYFDRYIRHKGIELVDNHFVEYFTGQRSFTREELEHLGDLYDAEIQYVDSLVGEIEAVLRGRGIIDETVLVITADHGENLGDHGMVDHVFNLYETTIRIPLLIRYPKVFPPGRTDASRVQLLDLFPTLLHLAGAGGRFPSQGINIAGAEPGSIGRPILAEYYYPLQVLQVLGEPAGRSPLLAPFERRIRSLTEGDLKLILGDDGRAELYDLAADPAEKTDLATNPAEREGLVLLREHLMELIETCLPPGTPPAVEAPVQLDEQTLKKLRSLGYIK